MSTFAGEGGGGPAILGLAQPFSFGRVQLVPLALPQPAVTIGFTLPVTGAYWLRLAALSVALVSDANAGNRQVVLDVADGDSNVVARIPPAAVQAASLTIRYSWAIGCPPAAPANGTSQLAPLPALILPVGWQYLISIVGVQAGDRFGALTGLVERFPTGDYGYPVGVAANQEV